MKLILGLGKTGLSIARFLAKNKIAFKIADNRIKPPLLNDYTNEFTNSTLFLGIWNKNLLKNINEIFISPGIAQNETIIIWAKQQNITITSDIELFAKYAKAPIIGITGSNGKSTVTQLIGEIIINDNKNVAIGGNIGKPALYCLDDKIDYYVLELSSYQLDYINNLELIVGVIINISPDHLDRYDGFNAYIKSKLSIYKYCKKISINADEKLVPKNEKANYFSINKPISKNNFGVIECSGKKYLAQGDKLLLDTHKMYVIGEHNISNSLAALSVISQININLNSAIKTIENFKGLEHRLEFIAKKDKLYYYNDSKATNAIATITAITALIARHDNIVLILGGITKQEDYYEMFTLINNHISKVVLIGQSTASFAKNINKSKINYAASMQDAVNTANTLIDEGVILLSPACASFDMFDNFQERGKCFKMIINKTLN